jgi:outer membrane protein
MPKSSHVALAAGLGLVCLITLDRPTHGQDDAAPAAAAAPNPARIGCVDMEKVFKEYKKFKFTTEQFKADLTAKQGELTKLEAEMRRIAGEMEGLNPTGNDFKAKQADITRLKVEHETQREQAQAEFARREAEALATIYKEVQSMTARVAKAKGLTYVVKISSEPITGSDPNSVMAAMARSIVFYDPGMDITNYVVHNLNLQYDNAGGAQPSPAPAATGAQPKADPAARQTAAPAPRQPARTAAPAATPTRR